MNSKTNNFEQDAKDLREAMKGLGTDEETIINITTMRSNKERIAIRTTYKSAFGRDLITDLDSELNSNLKLATIGMWRSPIEFDALEIYHACKGLGTDEDSLSEVIGSRSNRRLNEIKIAYEQIIKENLETRISDETSGDYRKLVIYIFHY